MRKKEARTVGGDKDGSVRITPPKHDNGSSGEKGRLSIE